MLTLANLMGVRVVIIGKSGDPLQEEGDGPRVVLCNQGSIDGAGCAASHFSYVWVPALCTQPVSSTDKAAAF